MLLVNFIVYIFCLITMTILACFIAGSFVPLFIIIFLFLALHMYQRAKAMGGSIEKGLFLSMRQEFASISDYRKSRLKRINRLGGSIGLCLLALVMAFPEPRQRFLNAFPSSTQATSVELLVHPSQSNQQTMPVVLNDQARDIELSSPSLITLKVLTQDKQQEGDPSEFTVAVQRPESERGYSYQMTFVEPGVYTASIHLDHTASIRVLSHSAMLAQATLKLTGDSAPAIDLLAVQSSVDGWLSSEPFPVQLKALSKNGLADIGVILNSEAQSSPERELVAAIKEAGTTSFAVDYEIDFSQYLTGDSQEFTLVGYATDYSSPEPLLGLSQEIVVTVISAYTYYKQTLGQIRTITDQLDTLADPSRLDKAQTLQSTSELWTSVLQRSKAALYFDRVDHATLRSFHARYQTSTTDTEWSRLNLNELKLDIRQFLHEHETIDDRERDRDFLTFLRDLSLTTRDNLSSSSLEPTFSRAKEFLAERSARWDLRLRALRSMPDSESSQKAYARGSRIDFRADLEATRQHLGEEGKLNPSLRHQAFLSSLLSLGESYTQWLELLEDAEDQARQSNQQRLTQGVQKLGTKLRQAQKQQRIISKALEGRVRSGQTTSKLDILTLQSQNKDLLEGLQTELQALMGSPSPRLAAASRYMESVLISAKDSAWASAETASDRTARLLRSAQQDLNKALRRAQGQRSRRKRVVGSGYHGTKIDGGTIDLKRDHRVGKRYRQDILEAHEQQVVPNQTEQELLDRYRRIVIR